MFIKAKFDIVVSAYPVFHINCFWIIFKQPINNVCVTMVDGLMQQPMPIFIFGYSLKYIKTEWLFWEMNETAIEVI